MARSGKADLEGGKTLTLRKETDRLAAACADCKGICFHCTINKQANGDWVVGPTFGEYQCSAFRQTARRHATTAYSAKQLAPLLVDTLLNAPNAKTADMKASVQGEVELPDVVWREFADTAASGLGRHY